MRASLDGKPYFLFPDVLKRWSFQKNRAGIWSFLYYRERWYFIFPKIWSYPLGGKWKTIFLKKKNKKKTTTTTTWKHDIFFKCSEKMVFSKRPNWNRIFLVLSGKVAFFPQEHEFSPLDRKGKMIFLKKYMEIWSFLCTRTDTTNTRPCTSVKKNIKNDLIPQKYGQRWLTF